MRFWFGKKKTDHDKKKTNVDKLVMGAILGVAIGSVVGASLLPKKKKDTTISEKKIHKNSPDVREKKKHKPQVIDAEIISNYKEIPFENGENTKSGDKL